MLQNVQNLISVLVKSQQGGSTLKDRGVGEGGGREGFWKSAGKGVNMLFKSFCRVVYNKSKCGSRGEMIWPLLNGVDSSDKAWKLQKLPKLLKKWNSWTSRKYTEGKNQTSNSTCWWLLHLELASFASTNRVLSFKKFPCMRAHLAPYCKFQIRTWMRFIHFNGKIL